MSDYTGGTVFPGGISTGLGLVPNAAALYDDFKGVLIRVGVGALGIMLIIVAVVIAIGSDKQLVSLVSGAASGAVKSNPIGGAVSGAVGSLS